MFSLQLSLVSVADNSHFCMFHINPYAKHKIHFFDFFGDFFHFGFRGGGDGLVVFWCWCGGVLVLLWLWCFGAGVMVVVVVVVVFWWVFWWW